VAADLAVITLHRILGRERAVLFVSHDADDGGWQFLDGQPSAVDDAAVAGLQQMFLLDPSLAELVGLPEGWCARRANTAWQRSPIS